VTLPRRPGRIILISSAEIVLHPQLVEVDSSLGLLDRRAKEQLSARGRPVSSRFLCIRRILSAVIAASKSDTRGGRLPG